MNHINSYRHNLPPTIKRVVETIDRYEMFEPGDRVLVGVSGGPDSMALLHILSLLSPRCNIQLTVAHLHHGLRPGAADDEAEFVKKAARSLNLPYYTRKADLRNLKGSVEELGRRARYAFFRELMHRHGCAKVALGHQKNDNAEAVLMHLLRGSGMRGLAGIPPVRDRWVVRPLIELDRSEILAFLKSRQIPFVEDVSNLDPAYERNRIRHQLIPLLSEGYNANIVDTLHRTADLCREDDQWLQQHLRPLLEKTIALSGADVLELHHPILSRQPLAVQRRLIRGALSQWHGHLRRIQAAHIEALVKLLPAEAAGKRISLPHGIEAERDEHGLRFTKSGLRSRRHEPAPRAFRYQLPGIESLPASVDLPQCQCRLLFDINESFQVDKITGGGEDKAWFDLDKIDFPLIIRNFIHGDRIRPYGLSGSQKIKKLFIDRKIPRDRRSAVPILESSGSIIWVAGIRRGCQAKVSRKTRKVLQVQAFWSSSSQSGSGGRPVDHIP